MHKSKEVLNSFAKLASDAFLGKSKTSLNSSLEKIAKTEGLEPHQIEYVAAQANNQVWTHLFGMDKKASYDFPLADPEEVINKLQVKAAPVIKEASLDYMTPPKRYVSEKVASGCVDDGESEERKKALKRAKKKELESRMEKAAYAKDELHGKMIALQSKIQNLQLDFVKESRAFILETAFQERGQVVDKIAEFVRSSIDMKKEAALGKDLMKKLSHVLKHQGLIKEADLKAPEQYISENLPARIINGRHSLYITINTLREAVNNWETCERAHEIVDSSLPFIKEKIRAL